VKCGEGWSGRERLAGPSYLQEAIRNIAENERRTAEKKKEGKVVKKGNDPMWRLELRHKEGKKK